MKQTHYYTNKHEATTHLNELKTKYNKVVMLPPDLKENGLYTFIIE